MEGALELAVGHTRAAKGHAADVCMRVLYCSPCRACIPHMRSHQPQQVCFVPIICVRAGLWEKASVTCNCWIHHHTWHAKRVAHRAMTSITNVGGIWLPSGKCEASNANICICRVLKPARAYAMLACLGQELLIHKIANDGWKL